MSDLLDVPESAMKLKVSVYTMRAWIFQKRLPVVRLGRRVLLKREDLEKLIEKNTHPAK
jgi:excisionase family DNA binding protein